jgi:hypothetical protein
LPVTFCLPPRRLAPYHPLAQVFDITELRLSMEPPAAAFNDGKLKVHVPTEYKQLAATAKDATEWSLYEEICERFTTAGATVVPEPTENTPTVIMLCPDLYTEFELCLGLSNYLPDKDQCLDSDKELHLRKKLHEIFNKFDADKYATHLRTERPSPATSELGCRSAPCCYR